MTLNLNFPSTPKYETDIVLYPEVYKYDRKYCILSNIKISAIMNIFENVLKLKTLSI